MSPKGKSPGANIFFGPQTEAGPLDPLGPLAEVDFLSGFRARGMDKGQGLLQGILTAGPNTSLGEIGCHKCSLLSGFSRKYVY